MSKKLLFALWGGLFILCAGLGFIPETEGFFAGVLKALAIGFFVPGFVLLYRGKRAGDRNTVVLVRNLSAASLIATVALIMANFLSIGAGKAAGDALYAMLVILSSPMICGGSWLLSLFLWACLLVSSLEILDKRK